MDTPMRERRIYMITWGRGGEGAALSIHVVSTQCAGGPKLAMGQMIEGVINLEKLNCSSQSKLLISLIS